MKFLLSMMTILYTAILTSYVSLVFIWFVLVKLPMLSSFKIFNPHKNKMEVYCGGSVEVAILSAVMSKFAIWYSLCIQS